MGRRGDQNFKPFSAEIRKWRHVGGAVGSDGMVVDKPWLLAKAEFIDTLCQRYHCLPSQLLNEPADILLQMIAVLNEGAEARPEQSMEDILANASRLGNAE